ncbi:hypothetical protein [uncultured Vibrio sp.]|nr:hypothetical protein [uncultured Vibrio sp.]
MGCCNGGSDGQKKQKRKLWPMNGLTLIALILLVLVIFNWQ